MATRKPPSESQEQIAVVRWLRTHNVDHFAVPNGAKVSHRQRNKLIKEGLTSGVADLIITDPPPAAKGVVVVALEMKKRTGGSLRAIQREWLSRHQNKRGWRCIVAYGAQEAIVKLQELGYGE